MKRPTRSALTLILMALVLFSACENDSWNNHYQTDSSIVSDKSLWETIDAHPELQQFAAVLAATGYDKILSKSRMYTVWAPNNDAMAGLNTNDIAITREFVENHIAIFSFPASGFMNRRITLHNGKTINFISEGNNFHIGTAALSHKNIIASNGILHIIDNRVPFFSNIWEYLEKDPRLDSIRSFLYSFNKIMFDEMKSVPGDVNEEGKTVYLDSVFYNANIMFNRLGHLNSEDTTFKVILPTNEAWTLAYDSIKKSFRYFHNNAATKLIADTLTRHHTLRSLVQDLVFNLEKQGSTLDSLVSTSNNVFHQPEYLFEGAEKITASNGEIHITNKLKFNHWESWNKKIVVEAERISGREYVLANLYNRSAAGSTIEGISGNRFIELTPTTSAVNPYITFEIPNTLSNTPYNIYCQFVPATAKNPNATDTRPSKVTFQLYFANESGSIINRLYNNSGESFVTNPDSISKILVVSDFVFPFANYGQETNTVRLRVNSNVPQNQTTLFTRELLIDCIILEPAR